MGSEQSAGDVDAAAERPRRSLSPECRARQRIFSDLQNGGYLGLICCSLAFIKAIGNTCVAYCRAEGDGIEDGMGRDTAPPI